MRLCLSIALLLACAGLADPAAAGKLDEMRDTVHGDDAADNGDPDDDDDDDEDDDDGSSVVGELLVWFLDAAIDPEPVSVETEAPQHRWDPAPALQLRSEYAYDLDGVHRPALGARWFLAEHFGFDVGVLHYIEILDQDIDQLLLGDANLLLRWWPDEALIFSIGAGGLWLYDRPRVDLGPNLTMRLDALLWPHLILSTRADLSWIDEALVLHGRATLGLQVSVAELYLGYDGRGFVGLTRAVLFHGPVAGLRARF